MSGAIWLASYPKSGNTWARLALFALRGGGEEDVLPRLRGFGTLLATYEVMEQWLGVEAGHLTRAEIDALRPDLNAMLFANCPEPFLCKVHDAWMRSEDGRPFFDPAVTHATLYLVRDPRDVAVSWARFMQWELDAAIDMLGNAEMTLHSRPDRLVLQLPQKLTDWSGHVTSWLDTSGLDPLVVRYEDMLADPAAALRRMAERAGYPADAGRVAAAVEATRFERLAGQEAEHGFLERAGPTLRFFRSGKAGQWRELLSSAQVRRVERDHGAVMARLGYL